MSKIAPAAACTAFILSAGAAVWTAHSGISALPFAVVPLGAGISILRRRVWGAWGFALFEAAQLASVAAMLATGEMAGGIIAGCSAAFSLAPAALFYFIGRQLKAEGAAPGLRWPWVTAAAITTVPFLFVQAFLVPTVSMEDTLLSGDKVLVKRFSRSAPRRGALAVFACPPRPSEAYVDRIIGAPGDRIRIVNRQVFRNGQPLSEPYAKHVAAYADFYRDNFPSDPPANVPDSARRMLATAVNGEIVVPPHAYFLLGDNRGNSFDSRYWGFVPEANLRGVPLLIYDSYAPADSSPQAQSDGGQRWNRLLKLL